MGTTFCGKRRFRNLPKEYREAVVCGFSHLAKQGFHVSTTLECYKQAFDEANPMIKIDKQSQFVIMPESQQLLGYALKKYGVRPVTQKSA